MTVQFVLAKKRQFMYLPASRFWHFNLQLSVKNKITQSKSTARFSENTPLQSIRIVDINLPFEWGFFLLQR